MNKLLMSTAVCLALVSSVLPSNAADSIPAKFRGEWCASSDDRGYERRSCLDSEEDRQLKVRANSYGLYETGCGLVSVKGERMKFKCEGEGSAWDSIVEMRLDGERLIIREISHSKERECKTIVLPNKTYYHRC